MKSLISSQVDEVPATGGIQTSVDSLFRLATATILIASVDYRSQFPDYTQFALATCLLCFAIYFATSYFLSHGKPEETAKIQGWLAYLDAYLLGTGLVLIPFSATVIAAIALLVAIRALVFGGLPRFFGHVATLAGGFLATATIKQSSIQIQPLETVSITVFIAAVAFLCYVGARLFQQQQQLSTTLKQTRTENLQLKLNNYKLAKYLSPSLRKAILSGKRVALETQRKKVTVFFSDIKGFSELSEELETESLTELLNLYLTEMSDIALKFGGTVDKFIGDAIMVFFGDPISRGTKEDCVACVAMALAMQKRMQDLNLRWRAQGIKAALHVRMGINTGFCTVGNFGTENRLDYTLLGTEVNKASRLESAAQAGEILISRATYELVKDVIYCENRGHQRLKGFAEPVEAFAAVDLRANLGKEGLCLDRATDGFSIYLDVENIPHLQKQRVMASLEEAYEQLRVDIERNTRSDIKIIK